MKSIKLRDVEQVMTLARGLKLYVAMQISNPDCDEPELVINPPANAKARLEYYKDAYNDECELKANPNIKITRCLASQTIEGIIRELNKK